MTIFNASLKSAAMNPFLSHGEARIPGSILFDFDKHSEQSSKAPYMLPSNEQFSQGMKEMDVRKSDTIVVYDKVGMLSAPRAYWMLKSFGVHDVRILDGTFVKWQKEGFDVESGDKPSAWKNIDRKT